MFNFLFCPEHSNQKTQQHRVDAPISLTYHSQTALLTSPVSYCSPEIKIEKPYQRLSSQHAAEELGQGLLVVIVPNWGNVGKEYKIEGKEYATVVCQ